MNMNFVEVLPVSKPPPEASARSGSPAAESRRADVPSFEETLRARQREERLSQSQAEAAALQSAAAAQVQPASPPNGEAPPVAGSPAPVNAESGALPGVLSGQALLPGAVVEGAGKPVAVPPAGVETPAQPVVETAPVLEQALQGAAPQPQTAAKGAGEAKPPVAEAPASPATDAAAATLPNPKAEVEARREFRAEPLLQATPAAEGAPAPQPTGVPADAAASPNPAIFAMRDEALPHSPRLMTDMVRQIASQMEASIQHGRSSLRLQLNPQDLGAIDIRFTSNSQGISVTVFAEQASTGRLLETQLNHLRQSLNEAGVNLTQLNIHHHNLSHQHGGYAGQNPHGRAAPNRATADEPATALDATAGWHNSAASGVDYRV